MKYDDEKLEIIIVTNKIIRELRENLNKKWINIKIDCKKWSK